MPINIPSTPPGPTTPRSHVRISEYSPRTAPNLLETTLSFWRDVHPQVARRARDAYATGDFAAAIKEALNAVHAAVQDRVRNSSGIDLDGETLMNRTFAPGRPIIELDDLSTKAGRDTHHGLMKLFAGSMTGFTDALGGGRVAPDDRQARHVIYLASLLMDKFDDSSLANLPESIATHPSTETFSRLC